MARFTDSGNFPSTRFETDGKYVSRPGDSRATFVRDGNKIYESGNFGSLRYKIDDDIVRDADGRAVARIDKDGTVYEPGNFARAIGRIER